MQNNSTSGKTPGKKKKDRMEPNHNPADEGLDHNILKGNEEDYEDSYLDKQEAHGSRGVDNEDTTDIDDEGEPQE